MLSLFPLFSNELPYVANSSRPFATNPAVLSHAPPDKSYIPYIVPVELAFVPFSCVHTYAFVSVLAFNFSIVVSITSASAEEAALHPVTAYTLVILLFKVTLFIYIFFPFNPYLLWLKYAIAPHSLFFIK